MTQGRIIHEAGEAEASGPGPGLPGIGLQRKFSTTLGAEISTLCLTKTPTSFIFRITPRKKWYNFNNFRCTESWENFTSDYQQVAHLTWIMSIALHYLVKYNSSDAACRIVDNMHNTSTSSCQPLTCYWGRCYYKFGWLNCREDTQSWYEYLFRYVPVK